MDKMHLDLQEIEVPVKEKDIFLDKAGNRYDKRKINIYILIFGSR